MKLSPLEWDKLTPKQKSQLAALNIEAYPLLYNSLGLAGKELSVLSERLFEIKGTELSNTVVAYDDDDVVGFMSALAEDEFGSSAARSAFEMIKWTAKAKREEVIALMKEISTGRSDIPPGSYYLSRLAVSASRRGGGVAENLMTAFDKQAGQRRKILHVAAENLRAIAFYTRIGFSIVEAYPRVLTMAK